MRRTAGLATFLAAARQSVKINRRSATHPLHLDQQPERAEWTADAEERQRLMTVVVIGGGDRRRNGRRGSGIPLQNLQRRFQKNKHATGQGNYPATRRAPLGFHPSLSEQTRRDLERLGVTVITGAGVQSIEKTESATDSKTKTGTKTLNKPAASLSGALGCNLTVSGKAG